ncbi:type II secretion system F family protein [Legionella quateirensis]|uniref:Pilus assembly protein PilC n=1 Tax=Legionella quateirensis TaxID=45072 RepID=A0A378KTZ1_9GAMM|nr:type II secretion system F family protein [Legionella quateirensis]KTD50713.1 pilus assembly protein PilC [Legionella quateirensis]STY18042.1 pilus assembly protein PilC [Legionella quateirensis]
MPQYTYTARDQNGKALSGQRNAANPEELANQLIADNLIPIDISISTATSSTPAKQKVKWFESKVPQSELHMFCRQMYSLLHAGIPLATSVERLSETTHNTTLSEALIQILHTLNKGTSLHVAMAQYPNIFTDFFLNLIIVGENTGNLDKIFLHLADYLELEVDITKKVKTALRYPTMVIVAIVVALIIINVFVIPSFAKLYASFQSQLPLPTRILMASSNFILSYWYLMIGFAVLTILGIRAYVKTDSGAMFWGRLQLKIPIIGWLIHRILLARFARLLALVLRAGIPAVEGIQMVGASTGNLYVANKIKSVTDLIVRGNTISAAITQTELFPPLIIQMISLGEESGTIDELLDEVAEYYQREINYDIVRLSDAIEPILLVVMAGMVLILALGVLLPMWSMASLIQKR